MLEKDRVQTLLDEGIKFAEMMLKEHQEFHPFGWAMNPSAEPVSIAIDMGEEFPSSQDTILALYNTFADEGKVGNYIATAIFYDVRVVPPNSDIKSDAIAVALDDVNGFSRIVFKPYQFEDDELIFGDLFAQAGENKVFGKPS